MTTDFPWPMLPDGSRLRFNSEYFGYIVGYPDGNIVLARHEAGPLLARGASLEELRPHLLPELPVKDGFHLNTPLLIWLEITRQCNLECPHCYINGGEARNNELSTDEILKLIDEFAKMGVWAIALTGGEPTLHKDFAKIVHYARSKELLVGIATHGMFLSQKLLEELPKDGVIISISWDDLHIAGGRKDADFKVTSRAAIRAKLNGFEVNIMTNTHRKNVHKLSGLIQWAEENNISVRSVPFTPLGRGHAIASDYENLPLDAHIAADFWLKECRWEHEYHKRVGLCVGAIFNYGLSLAYMTRRCSSGRYLAYISSDGTTYPCTMCAGENILSAGNVRDKGFQALWRSSWEIRKYSWDNFQDTCSGCALDRPEFYCASRCPAMSHARHGRFFDCGASDFEKLSTVIRTALLANSPLARETGRPVTLAPQQLGGEDD